ncbi:MAG: hypothetical protein JEZ03_15975 [Bacteroidales bacterium]|nr:hypothetical protein [Bacteroidales bacterium]
MMLTLNDLKLTMTVCLFVVGIVAIGAGIFILVTRVISEDLRIISNQTAHLVKKGVAEDVSGLVGNASSLIDSINQLIKTTSGIGFILVLIGVTLLVGAYYLLVQIF